MTRVLVVCTGNVCRSPAAERLLATRLPAGAGVTVTSAGTSALVGRAIDPPVAELLRLAGADPTGFAARQLQADQIRAADVVLVMERSHRAAVVGVEPTAVRRTFLLAELGAIAPLVAATGWPADVPADPAARLAALPGLAGRHRPRLARSGGPEVADPFRQSPEVQRHTFATIADRVDEIVAAVTQHTGDRRLPIG
ncbi:arsenate reductase/protein-tyrosine-phosphatase family protein [Modestobacter sp. SYSU DS0875]